MSDIEIIKIVFGLLGAVGFIVLLFISFKLFYPYLIQEKRCIAKTKGVVKNYAVNSKDGYFSPKVYYTVDNKEYKAIGPRYRFIIKKSGFSPVLENDMWFHETEKQDFVIYRQSNSLITINENPMAILYPKGSEIDIYYDPNNPKLSYVLRYCNLKFAFWLTFIIAISLLIMAVLLQLLL